MIDQTRRIDLLASVLRRHGLKTIDGLLCDLARGELSVTADPAVSEYVGHLRTLIPERTPATVQTAPADAAPENTSQPVEATAPAVAVPESAAAPKKEKR